jgi:hypothetical protein
VMGPAHHFIRFQAIHPAACLSWRGFCFKVLAMAGTVHAINFDPS